MSFTDMLWSDTAELQDTIQTMPFNTQLANGTLRQDVFQGYIIQDAHYLEGFARALALTASRATDPQAIAQLAGSANGAIAVERQLHAEYMSLFKVSPSNFAKTPPSQACDHYINFLIRSASIDPFPVAVTALLPCFWIYHRVGQAIDAKATKNNPYQAWIDTYASDAFAASVQSMLDLTNILASQNNESMRKAMKASFARSSWHEWMFWHSAFQQDGWASHS
ncbi:thiaminase II [uncultured Roseobacter sp.]|uniref:thiaminase II n=1 Tax=uncultured Roseobacter sp. TaxID=114847 RepID=UPI0026193351|nr:thiaminase II [uncultured Roseobacter sp.]